LFSAARSPLTFSPAALVPVNVKTGMLFLLLILGSANGGT
jgi:hypothetical protein